MFQNDVINEADEKHMKGIYTYILPDCIAIRRAVGYVLAKYSFKTKLFYVSTVTGIHKARTLEEAIEVAHYQGDIYRDENGIPYDLKTIKRTISGWWDMVQVDI
jgi:hypothetical protein